MCRPVIYSQGSLVVVHVLHVVLVVPVVVPVVDREADGSGTMVTGRSISWALQP